VNIPPAMRLAAAAGVARSESPAAPTVAAKLSSRVKIVNSVSNGSGFVRRRDAEFFIASGRAVHAGKDAVGRDQIRLFDEHAQNRAAARRAACDDACSFRQNRPGVVYWNGDAGSRNVYRPGEVKS
jgi:hypothetical protein